MARKKSTIKKAKSKEEKPNPTAEGLVFIHVPDLRWDDISACRRVRMVWTHLIAFPNRGDSIEELRARRVCGSCLRRLDIKAHYKLTD